MSFRSRLTLFFVLIVLVPMVSLTVVLFRLLADNENGKADARVAARQTAALRLYDDARRRADAAAERIGADVPLATALRSDDASAAKVRAAALLKTLQAKRIVIVRNGMPVVDVGAGNATFPIERRLVDRDGSDFGTLRVSVTGPRAYTDLVHRITGMEVVLRAAASGAVLATSFDDADQLRIPQGQSTVRTGGQTYRSAAFTAPGFERGNGTVVAVLDHDAARASDVRSSRVVAAIILFGFFVLAFTFAVLVSRSLQRQIEGFLEAARRIARGDFSTKVPTIGHDEFAELGEEFNRMSVQLEQRLEELRAEQTRVARAMRRIGDAFASNLDRDALLEIVLRTALDGVAAAGGRAMLRTRRDGQLHQTAQAGSLDDLVPVLHAAESAVLESGTPRDARTDGFHALAHPLRAGGDRGDQGPPRLIGIVSVARAGRPFSDAERELFHYLAGQAAVSVENVDLHQTVERQAVTDELTGLSNRRRFQEVLGTEVERSRRFGQPVSLVMLDIDNFKRVNDTYGHQSGDLVLQEVARILKETSREIDEPARYGGEELAVVLPNTDAEGAHTIAERVREGIEALRLDILTADGSPLQITASLGAATHPASAGDDRDLVEAADAALYEAKRTGKNRTVAAGPLPRN